MAKYDVTILNGQGSTPMREGTYTVSVFAPGYGADTLIPTTYTATSSEGTEAFTVEGAGTLTFNVNETGAAGGTPITAGTIVMTDSTGTTQYGSAVTIGTDGNAVFEKVPYGTTEAPFALFFKQTESDATHIPYDGVITVNMTSATQTEYVKNDLPTVQTFTLADATYSLPIANAMLSFD